jgi:hypothetical protein
MNVALLIIAQKNKNFICPEIDTNNKFVKDRQSLVSIYTNV